MRSLNLPASLFLLLSIALVFSCNQGKVSEIEKRERELNKKQEQLTLLEEQLRLKKAELLKRESELDSLSAIADTNGVYNAALIGDWQVRMKCTETTCEGSAIGDTKTEKWRISYEKNSLIVKSIVKDKVVRTYTGAFKNNSVKLIATQATAESVIRVSLTPTLEDQMEGIREVMPTGGCEITYAIVAEKLKS